MDLFEKSIEEKVFKEAPLAYKMRPKTLEHFVGQKHILGEGKLLKKMIEKDSIGSIILWGKPGTGKTALAYVIASITKSNFEELNAVTAKVSDIRDVIKKAKEIRKMYRTKTILFIDELHRFNKAQQDALLPDVEKGTIALIGATTHNPFFSVISALVSRSMVFELKPLESNDIEIVLERAVKDKECGLGNLNLDVKKEALNFIIKMSEGDLRRALNGLELAVLTKEPNREGIIVIDLKTAEEAVQKKSLAYSIDDHYDIISAFIKSMRGGDPDAALYWLARMIVSGEDPAFIARRIVICASEDVGNADPQALVVASAALNAVEFVGLPEAIIPLSQAVTYIASAPKSNASYLAINSAMEDVENGELVEIPEYLRDTNRPACQSSTPGRPGAKEVREKYKYPHDYPNGKVQQDYIPKKKKYYFPKDIGFEKEIRRRLDNI